MFLKHVEKLYNLTTEVRSTKLNGGDISYG